METRNSKEKISLELKTILSQKTNKKFISGKTKIHYSGPIFDEREINSVIENLLQGWLAEGKKTLEFEKEFSKYIGVNHCVVTTSGSFALLLAFATLMDKNMDNYLKKGDEVITSALTFPTTLNSIILNGLEPVFVDVDLDTYNMDPDLIEDMITEKTKVILVTHHLGYPCDMDKIMAIAKKYRLKVIEDCCDAHGAEYKGKKLGSFGDMACFSFYCAHAMTMGEGGAIVTNNEDFVPLLISLKTCGRACVCTFCKVAANPDYKCPHRWESKVKGFEDYDKRTLYTHLGYKAKILDLQSAFGLEQLQKLPFFIQKRTNNFNFIVKHLQKYSNYLLLPKITKEIKPSWFSVPLTIKKDAPFTRKKLVDWLEKHNIETRPLLGGNLLKQPAFKDFTFRTTILNNTNFFHTHSFYIGCYPGITLSMRKYMIKVFDDFFKEYIKK